MKTIPQKGKHTLKITTVSISVIAAFILTTGVLSAQSRLPVVVQVTSGTAAFSAADAASFGIICPCFFGQTFTTPSGGPWNNITFNFYGTPAVGSSSASTPFAAGTAFVLTQPYFGTPEHLSSSTPGYLAASTSIVAGAYVFPVDVTLNPNTKYWLYENGPALNGTTITAVENGFPDVFVSSMMNGAQSAFFEGLDVWNYTVGGTPVASGSCTYVLNSGGQSFLASGASATINITAPAGCSWTAASAASWITITGASNGTGNGILKYQVAVNSGPSQSGAINITTTTGNLSYLVLQSAGSIAATGGGAITQLASAGGWTTTFTFVNMGSTAAHMRLSFFGNDGTRIVLPLTFPQSPNALGPILAPILDQTIAPGAELIIQTAGPDSQPINVGWAQFLTDGNVSGFALYSQVAGSAVQDALVPLQTGNVGGYAVAFDNTNGSTTGIAIANTTAQTIKVSATVFIAGAIGSTTTLLNDGTFTLTLPPMSHMSFFLTDHLGSDTVQQRGTVQFVSPAPGQISVLALRFNSTGAFSTVPALPMSN